ncbi:hypothetical protein DY000_02007586 [Brassica cretica]|uniref:Uncharacterized protein n=1 Tax=Brassica cretica TaxID=69181 RepID=A0ABQ7BWL0_BRACR|nr:hypothetical protein DY000_02007586 [Brassica cretica]
MSSSTRSNKETQLLFSSDPASLERSIRKGICSSLIDNNTCSSFDFRQPPSNQTLVSSTDTRSPLATEDTLPSTDIIHPTSIDNSVRTSIDTEPRDIVATLIRVREEKGDLRDQEGTTLPVDEAARPRTLADYHRPDQFCWGQNRSRRNQYLKIAFLYESFLNTLSTKISLAKDSGEMDHGAKHAVQLGGQSTPSSSGDGLAGSTKTISSAIRQAGPKTDSARSFAVQLGERSIWIDRSPSLPRPRNSSPEDCTDLNHVSSRSE